MLIRDSKSSSSKTSSSKLSLSYLNQLHSQHKHWCNRNSHNKDQYGWNGCSRDDSSMQCVNAFFQNFQINEHVFIVSENLFSFASGAFVKHISMKDCSFQLQHNHTVTQSNHVSFNVEPNECAKQRLTTYIKQNREKYWNSGGGNNKSGETMYESGFHLLNQLYNEHLSKQFSSDDSIPYDEFIEAICESTHFEHVKANHWHKGENPLFQTMSHCEPHCKYGINTNTNSSANTNSNSDTNSNTNSNSNSNNNDMNTNTNINTDSYGDNDDNVLMGSIMLTSSHNNEIICAICLEHYVKEQCFIVVLCDHQ